jgi:hypothetical protein
MLDYCPDHLIVSNEVTGSSFAWDTMLQYGRGNFAANTRQNYMFIAHFAAMLLQHSRPISCDFVRRNFAAT